MSISFEVATSTSGYEVAVETGRLLAALAEPGERVYFVDQFLEAVLRGAGIDPIVIVADESAKSLDRMSQLIFDMRGRGVSRDTVLVAVGGGVVQDAAAFVASIYMRGLAWIYIPTTLLSMVDSCIGGKSSINVGQYKNIVGTIHPPQRVIIDPLAALTLTHDQKVAGLCEAVKICACRGPEALNAYLALDPSTIMPVDRLTTVIVLSLQHKKWFIEIDEFDKAERLLLNFGHTFGHAIEVATDFRVSHGIAVGLGMLSALYLGVALNIEYGEMSVAEKLRNHVTSLLASIDGSDVLLAGVEVDRLMDAFESDKKHRKTQYAVIIVTAQGSVERRLLPRDSVSAGVIRGAFSAMISDWSSEVCAGGPEKQINDLR